VPNLALTHTKQITVRGARRKGEIKRRAQKNLKREKMPGGKKKWMAGRHFEEGPECEEEKKMKRIAAGKDLKIDKG
jgi:hypothetical protein